MLGKYIFFLLIVCTISQVKCQNPGNERENGIPRSFIGEILRCAADLRRQFANMIDKVIFSFKNALKNNDEGLFGGFKKIFGKNRIIETYQPEQDNEADDMNVEPQVEEFTNRQFLNQKYNRRFMDQNYNGRPIRSDFIFKLISDLCAEGRNIPGICN
ncbi:uncharacterized protein LOC123262233 [Cotesia glomerata]|uniref:uncharacterized protein LOC123262233 n=1 Tax=Cotesia glomerata TaxID=32391 RepID=UPI001D006B1B|nr:uncharacterized protein LOC123262233 [Cotesia glomerata]